jgi:hypothetical protein
MCRQILVKQPKKFVKIRSAVLELFTFEQTDKAKLMGTFLRLLVANVPKAKVGM